jgi:hypothetical protein
MTLLFSMSFFVGVAESKTERIVPATLTAQIGTTQEQRNEALRLTQLGIQHLNTGRRLLIQVLVRDRLPPP